MVSSMLRPSQCEGLFFLVCYNICMILFIFLFGCLVGTLVLLFVISTSFWGFWRTRVPYVRSKTADTLKVLKAAGLRDGQVFYELGSGDGRVIFLAEQLAKVQAVGFELTPWVHMTAKFHAWRKGSKARLLRQDFFATSWKDADVIYCYLYPPLMRSVEEKFLTETKPGSVLISRDFKLPNLQPVQEVVFDKKHNAFIYKRI